MGIVLCPTVARFRASRQKMSSSGRARCRGCAHKPGRAGASGAIAKGIAPLLLASDDPATPEKLTQARKIFEGLQHGTIDRSLFTDNANFYFNEQALKDFAGSLARWESRRNLSKFARSCAGV